MVHNLIQVCLLTMTMGVGAKASTPINLNRQETQKQQRQLLEENNSDTFQYIMGVPTPTYQTDLDFSTPTGYNWSYGSGSYTNDVYRLTNYTYTYSGALYDVQQVPNNPVYWGLVKNEMQEVYKADVWTLEPNMLVYNNDFVKNVRLNLVPVTNTETTFNIKLDLYQSTDPAFEEVCEWSTYEYHVDTIDNLLNGGTIRNYQKTTQTYQFTTTGQTDDYHTFGFDLNIVQGTKNYYALLYSIESIETEDDENVRLMDAFNSANNGANCTVFESTATVIQGIWTPATVTYEYIDLPGLLWEILGMPFTFIGTAFNLTLFPGTPYQINFANLVMTIFGVLVFVFIVGIIRRRT